VTGLLFFLACLLPPVELLPDEVAPIAEHEREFVRREIEALLPGVRLVVAPEKLNELAWARRVHFTLQPSQREFRLWDGTRVDLLTPHHAIEVEWASKWSQSFGQTVYYAENTQVEPAVILLVNDLDAEQHYVNRARVVGARLKIPIWLVDTKRNRLLLGGDIFDLEQPPQGVKDPGDRTRVSRPVPVDPAIGPATTVRR
jgi:hypothetical protein